MTQTCCKKCEGADGFQGGCWNEKCQCHTQTFVEEMRGRFDRWFRNSGTSTVRNDAILLFIEAELRAFGERIVPEKDTTLEHWDAMRGWNAAIAAMRERINRELGK